MLPRMMGASISSRSRVSKVFTLARVPTGMKMGVGTVPWGSTSSPARARPSVACTLKMSRSSIRGGSPCFQLGCQGKEEGACAQWKKQKARRGKTGFHLLDTWSPRANRKGTSVVAATDDRRCRTSSDSIWAPHKHQKPMKGVIATPRFAHTDSTNCARIYAACVLSL